MEKQGAPPSYAPEGVGYGAPQAPPNYNQAQGNPSYPQQPYPQQYPGGAPQQSYAHQQYPNVVIHQPITVAAGPPPPDHMTAAIFATLCCFWPTGIIAIMKANDAKSAWMRGDTTGAHSLAQSAKTFVNVSIIAGILSIILAAVIVGVYVGVILKNIDSYDDTDYYD